MQSLLTQNFLFISTEPVRSLNMNHIYLFNSSFFDDRIFAIPKRFFASLTPRQQQICLVATFALSCLTACCLIVRYCLNGRVYPSEKESFQSVNEMNFCHLQDLEEKDLQKIHKGLKKLNLSGCYKLNRDVIKRLPEGLEELSIYFGKYLSETLEDFPKGLKKLHLLYCNHLTNENIKNISRYLEELSLLNCINLSDEGVENLPPLLKVLKLSNTPQLMDECIKKLPVTLEELYLYSCPNLTDEALDDLPQSLKTLYLDDSHQFSELALAALSKKIKVVQQFAA